MEKSKPGLTDLSERDILAMKMMAKEKEKGFKVVDSRKIGAETLKDVAEVLPVKKDELAREAGEEKLIGEINLDVKEAVVEGKKEEPVKLDVPEEVEMSYEEIKASLEKDKKLEGDELQEALKKAREDCAVAMLAKDKAEKSLNNLHGLRKVLNIFKKDGKNKDAIEGEAKWAQEVVRRKQEDLGRILKEYRQSLVEEKRKGFKNEFAETLNLPDNILALIKPGDSELEKEFEELAAEGVIDALAPEERKRYEGALVRKNSFLDYLKKNYSNPELAEEVYGKLVAGEQKNNNELEKYAKEVAILTTAKEATVLEELKHDKEIEEKKKLGENSKLEWIKEKGLVAGQWYRKLPMGKKLLLSGILFGSGTVAGAAGGIVGATLASGVFAGRWIQRILGASASGIGIEAGMKKAQEKLSEREISRNKEFADNFLKALQEKNSELDNKLFEILGKKDKQETRRKVAAIGAAVFIGSGAMAYLGSKLGVWDYLGKLTGLKHEIPTGGAGAKPGLEHLPAGKPGIGPPRLGEAGPPRLGEAGPPRLGEAGPPTEAPAGGISPGGGKSGGIIEKMLPRDLEKIHELAQIKSKGIEGALIAQLDHNPAKMGCPEDIIKQGKSAIHKWAGGQAHRIALDNGYVKTGADGKMVETWVRGTKKPAEFLLDRDPASGKFSVQEIDAKTYQHTVSGSGGRNLHLGGEDANMYYDEPPLKFSGGQVGSVVDNATTSVMEHQIELSNIDVLKEAIGFTQTEYDVIKNVKVKEFLNQIPPGQEAWEIWKGEVAGKTISLPHDGMYGAIEFNRQVKLTETLRKLALGSVEQDMTLGEFLGKLKPSEEALLKFNLNRI